MAVKLLQQLCIIGKGGQPGHRGKVDFNGRAVRNVEFMGAVVAEIRCPGVADVAASARWPLRLKCHEATGALGEPDVLGRLVVWDRLGQLTAGPSPPPPRRPGEHFQLSQTCAAEVAGWPSAALSATLVAHAGDSR
ncbi:hypothetical protein NDU88_001906 [Pleurodeles waltl]|uniref:Uncharacterized protein n=1 Tax=Pleurodeles waltl TaxID=8319 RepID=A0AAV7SDF9_PLEWA|nr:hypothetical protein NDU88_001906 [Pleurodeles waltl]